MLTRSFALEGIYPLKIQDGVVVDAANIHERGTELCLVVVFLINFFLFSCVDGNDCCNWFENLGREQESRILFGWMIQNGDDTLVAIRDNSNTARSSRSPTRFVIVVRSWILEVFYSFWKIFFYVPVCFWVPASVLFGRG